MCKSNQCNNIEILFVLFFVFFRTYFLKKCMGKEIKQEVNIFERISFKSVFIISLIPSTLDIKISVCNRNIHISMRWILRSLPKKIQRSQIASSRNSCLISFSRSREKLRLMGLIKAHYWWFDLRKSNLSEIFNKGI